MRWNKSLKIKSILLCFNYMITSYSSSQINILHISLDIIIHIPLFLHLFHQSLFILKPSFNWDSVADHHNNSTFPMIVILETIYLIKKMKTTQKYFHVHQRFKIGYSTCRSWTQRNKFKSLPNHKHLPTQQYVQTHTKAMPPPRLLLDHTVSLSHYSQIQSMNSYHKYCLCKQGDLVVDHQRFSPLLVLLRKQGPCDVGGMSARGHWTFDK